MEVENRENWKGKSCGSGRLREAKKYKSAQHYTAKVNDLIISILIIS